MKEFIDRHKIANTVRMLRARGYAGALVLVEGDDDARWLRKFLRPEETRPLPAFGKDRVLAALQALRDGASDEATDGWQICRGHDLVAVLLHGLCSIFGSQQPSKLNQDRLEASLRLAYTEEAFRQTGLYGALRAWQEQHPAYRLL